MQFVKTGNEKLGKNCSVISRPVGDSCPSGCFFLGNGCYAEFTEKRFPNARESAFNNMISDKNKIRSQIIWTMKNRCGKMRLHERGDFLNNDELDTQYLNDWLWALESLDREGIRPEGLWTYTHVRDSRILKLEQYGVSVYASIHNRKQLRECKKLGFTKFALCSKIKKTKGGSKDAPTYITKYGIKWLVCPEQRLGRKKVTCAGGAGTTACGACVFGRYPYILFLEH